MNKPNFEDYEIVIEYDDDEYGGFCLYLVEWDNVMSHGRSLLEARRSLRSVFDNMVRVCGDYMIEIPEAVNAKKP